MKNNKEIFEALALLEKERGIEMSFMLDKIKKAIITACKSSYNGNDHAIISMNENKGTFDVYLQKTVVAAVNDPGHEISLVEARKIDPNAKIDETVSVKLNTKEFGRIAAQTARNIIRQGIRDGERELVLKEFEGKKQELVTATVEKIDPRNGSASLKIGKSEAFLPKNEQLPSDNIHEGDHIKVYIVDVKEGDKGPHVLISRTHPDVIKRMFEAEVPEIYDGTVEIKNVAREAGSRTKISVKSRDKNVDAIGACIGPKGARISNIIRELNGEKIDIIEYNEDPCKFIAASLAPAEVLKVEMNNSNKDMCRAIVPNNQLSLAIGNKGQNARLAAKLTGFKIDIKPENEIPEIVE